MISGNLFQNNTYSQKIYPTTTQFIQWTISNIKIYADIKRVFGCFTYKKYIIFAIFYIKPAF